MISIFDLFSIGIGPSSSHTVGPMRAAMSWLLSLKEKSLFSKTNHCRVSLYGSLALTGKGHGTDRAILLGLLGYEPETIDPFIIENEINLIKEENTINLLKKNQVPFSSDHLSYIKNQKNLEHPNKMVFCAYNSDFELIDEQGYFSIGGGFITTDLKSTRKDKKQIPFPFTSGNDLLVLAKSNDMSISELMYKNEQSFNKRETINTELEKIWSCMRSCIKRGSETAGILPGGLSVKRRAPGLYQKLMIKKEGDEAHDPGEILDWLSLYALAVSEENAAGGRVVTAPTNGAAGIIPAVLYYVDQFIKPVTLDDLKTFFFTSGAIGILYKTNASISGAEMGCQGEIGVACSMAAAGYTALMGGTPQQIENAAEIGMEHHLGLTCDPVKGLVQIPCIERNTMGAITAINSSRLALQGNGNQKVSLDKVIKTMRVTGEDMKKRYKETSLGGLALHVTEC